MNSKSLFFFFDFFSYNFLLADANLLRRQSVTETLMSKRGREEEEEALKRTGLSLTRPPTHNTLHPSLMNNDKRWSARALHFSMMTFRSDASSSSTLVFISKNFYFISWPLE